MNCPSCGGELSIYSSFTEAEEVNGGLAVYSVIDLICTDPQCPAGARGIPVERVRRPIQNSASAPNAVSCCGVPLAYVGETAYRIPDERVIERTEENAVILRCGQCGARHELRTEGKTRV